MAKLSNYLADEFIVLDVLSNTSRSRVELVKVKSSGIIAMKKHIFQTNTAYPILKELDIAGIPKIDFLFQQQEETIIVEEWINGETLERKIAKSHLPIEEHVAARWMYQLALILKQLHKHSIIHRDIKPSNLMITPNGTIYLIDFDTARVYNPNQEKDTVCLGTKGYAPPEQYGYAQTDNRSDIYSFGVVFYQLVTGRLPGKDKEYHGKFSAVINRCLELDPKLRYATVDQVITALKPYNEERNEKKRSFPKGIVPCLVVFFFLAYLDFYRSIHANMVDKFIFFIQHSLLLFPLIAYFSDLLSLRSHPPMKIFQTKRGKIWFALVYFVLWFFMTILILAFLSLFLSPEAIRYLSSS